MKCKFDFFIFRSGEKKLPICPHCGSYYVRPPCPACSELLEEERKEQEISTIEKVRERTEKIEVTEKPSVSDKSPEVDLQTQHEQEIKRLKQKVKEQEIGIKDLKQVIKNIKDEITRVERFL